MLFVKNIVVDTVHTLIHQRKVYEYRLDVYRKSLVFVYYKIKFIVYFFTDST